MSDLTENELKVFIGAVLRYFAQMSAHKPEIKTTYLAQEATPSYGYTGLISISGHYRGCVYFTAPQPMLLQALLDMGESSASEVNLLDVVGEIANTIAGNARRYFGEVLEISVPIAFKGPTAQLRAAVRARPFVMIVHWAGYEAAVVVDIEARDA